MESPVPPQANDTDSVQRCLEQFSADLSARYTNDETVPSVAMGTRRFTAQCKTTGRPAFICLRQYASPLNSLQIDIQRAILARLEPAETDRLCGLMASRIEPHAHYVISTMAGPMSLHQVLRQQRRMDFATACELLRNIAEALESAVAARWPRCMVDLHALFISLSHPDGLRQPIKLIVPALPGPEIAAGTAGIPTSSQEYIQDLALMTCELLGMPVRNQRFRPLPLLSAEANQILRTAVESGQGELFESARAFAAVLRSGQQPHSAPYNPSTSTAPPSLTSAGGTAPVAPPVKPSPPLPANGNGPTVILPPQDRVAERKAPALPYPRAPEGALSKTLRLEPVRNGPIVTLCLTNELKLGRSVKTDYIAQFFPRSPRNDDRTRLISREHLAFVRRDSDLWVSNLPGANQSFISGKPLDDSLKAGRFCRISVAGEYDVELRKLDSWFVEGRPWKESIEPELAMAGATLLSPSASIEALDARTVWLFTDAGFGINARGELNLQPVSLRDALGWFLAAHGTIWIAAAEAEGSILLDGEALKAQTPLPLGRATQLRIGNLEWRVKALSGEPA